MTQACLFCKYPMSSPIVLKEKEVDGPVLKGKLQEFECRYCGAGYRMLLTVMNKPVRELKAVNAHS